MLGSSTPVMVPNPVFLYSRRQMKIDRVKNGHATVSKLERNPLQTKIIQHCRRICVSAHTNGNDINAFYVAGRYLENHILLRALYVKRQGRLSCEHVGAPPYTR